MYNFFHNGKNLGQNSLEVGGHWPLWQDEKTNDHVELTKVER